MPSQRLCDILARSWGMCSNGQRYSDGNRAARARGFQLGLLGVAGQAAQCIGALAPIAWPIALMCHSFAGLPPMARHNPARVSCAACRVVGAVDSLSIDGISRWCPGDGTERTPKVAPIVPGDGTGGAFSVPGDGTMAVIPVPGDGLGTVFLR